MDTNAIIEEIDAEIRRLEQAKTLLNGAGPANHIRPAKPGKRTMSTEAREKIAAAQRRRWARTKRRRSRARDQVGPLHSPGLFDADNAILAAEVFCDEEQQRLAEPLGNNPSRSAGGHGGGGRRDLVRPAPKAVVRA
jgi:hypothetical protein